ncbi:MAG: tail fiber domain-containing protein, partial [Candidatus Udaeobacter sp.]
MKTNTLYFIVFALLTYFAATLGVKAVRPTPDGCYPNFTTAEGCDALNSLTTGTGNTGLGWRSLFLNTTGSFSTGVGAGALALNTGDSNTATGAVALFLNTTGSQNTATGTAALLNNTDGAGHTAVGYNALATATAGASAFAANTAVGVNALFGDTTGNGNTAVGAVALFSNTTGGGNTAIGNFAGSALTTGDNNIDIGSPGAAAESNTIRIGVQGTQAFTIIAGINEDFLASGVPVLVSPDGVLGVAISSARFKEDIKSMDKASDVLLALKPVTFRYKKEIDPTGRSQFGLVADDVEKVNPDLVVRDKDGEIYTVRYDAVNAMLLNEFLKEHRKVEDLKKDFQATVAQQQKQIEALTTGLQKVSAQLEASKAA